MAQGWASQVGLVVKNPPANAGDAGLISEWGRSPGGRHGNPLQYSCLENPMDRGAQAGLQTAGKNWRLSMHACTRLRSLAVLKAHNSDVIHFWNYN